MAMDQFLAEYFHNNVKIASAQPPVDEEAEKNAQVELFQKLATDNGIDLDTLSEEQIAYLWDNTFNKTASDDDKDKEKDSEGDPEESKKEEAKKEHGEKKEAMAKIAEATFLGKVMAHSLVAELREISKEAEASDKNGDPVEEEKEAAMPPHLAKALGKGKELAGQAGKAVSGAASRGKELVTGSKAKALHQDATAGRKLIGAAAKGRDKAMDKVHGHGLNEPLARLREARGAAKDESKKVFKTRAGIAAGGAAAAAAGTAAAAHKKKESSAIDDLAIVLAIEKAAEAGWDVDQAAERVSGVVALELLGESEKVAAAEDADAAVEVRSLEFLEAAGYPVNWES